MMRHLGFASALAAAALALGASAPAGSARFGGTLSACGTPPCYTAFTVDGAPPPAGISLDISEQSGNILLQLKNSAHSAPLDWELSPALSNDSVVHAEIDLGDYDAKFFHAEGLLRSALIRNGDPNTLTFDAQPRSVSFGFSCSPGSCGGEDTVANVDFSSMLIGAVSDLAGAPGGAPTIMEAMRGTWVSTNAQAVGVPPTFNQTTNAFSFQVAGPHFKCNPVDPNVFPPTCQGGVVNEGFFKAFLPDALITEMGLDPSTVTDSSFEVTKDGGSPVAVHVSHEDVPSGVLIEAGTGGDLPPFEFSSPTFTITPAAAPAATKLAFTSAKTPLAAGSSRTLTAELRDDAHHLVDDSSTMVTFEKISGRGTVTNLGTATASHGVASRTVTGATAGLILIRASATGLTSAGTSFVVTPGKAHHLTFTSPTTDLPDGATRDLTAEIRDVKNNVVTTSSAVVNFSRQSGPGKVSGLGSVAAVSGVATKTVTGDGGGKITIRATSPKITPGKTSFNILAGDGSGQMSTGTRAVKHGATEKTIVFRYKAAAGGMTNGAVTLEVPSDWSAPSTTGADPGFTTANKGALAVSGNTITISGLTLKGNQQVVITYGSQAQGGPGANAPATAVGNQTWQAQQRSSGGGTLTNLASSPVIKVT